MKPRLITRSCWVGIVVSLGCRGSAETPPIESPPASCPAGEWLRDDGSCVPAGLPPDMPCPPGEWLRDDGECIPAGVPPDGCGEGFVHDGDRGCEPILPDAPCPPGLMAVPGETVCREIAPCASGKWGDIPVEPDTEYVDASYPGMDSDGSALKPWTSIQAGVDAASPFAIVAIASGSYLEDVSVSGNPVRLWGVCPRLVEVVGSGAALAAVVVPGGASGAEVRGLALSGDAVGFGLSGALDVLVDRVWVHASAGRGIDVESVLGPARMTLRGALVEQNHEYGVYVSASEATLVASVVRTTEPNAQGLYGRGVNVKAHPTTGASSTFFLQRSVVEQNQTTGVLVSGSEATVEATVIRTTQPDAQGSSGRGVEIQADPTTDSPSVLLLQRSLVEQSHDLGVFVSGSEATIEATVIRTTQLDARGLFGRGVNVKATTAAPSTLLLERSLVEQNHEIGVFVSGSEATIEASVVRATQLDAQGSSGRGTSVQADPMTGAPSTLFLQHSLVEQNHDVGVYISGAEATLEATVVRATQLDAQGLGGRGVSAQTDPTTVAPSTLLLQRSLVEQNHEAGVFVEGSDATIEASVFRITLPNAQGFAGRGVHVRAQSATGAPSMLLLERSLIEQSNDAGVSVVGSVATIASCVVRDTLSNADGLFGEGVALLSEPGPASATIVATRIERSARAAVAVWGADAAIGGSAFSCQAFDIDHESYQGKAATLEDMGGNLCGCPEATAACVGVSANLEPPSLEAGTP